MTFRNIGLINPEVFGRNSVGSLIGRKYYGNIYNCYAAGGSVTGNNNVGGLAGENFGTDEGIYYISNCYSTATVTGNYYVGGLVGNNDADAVISNCYAAGVVSGAGSEEDSLGGLVGSNSNVVSNSFYDKTVSGRTDTGKGIGLTTTEMKKQGNFTGWDFAVVGDGTIGNWIMAGYPHLQMEHTTTITTLVQLQLMAVDLTASYILANNINATATSTWNWVSGSTYSGFAPVGDYYDPFTGIFNGTNKTITGLYINRETSEIGLFGATSSADISNVGLVGGTIIGTNASYDIGSLVGWLDNYSTVSNCYNTGTVTGDYGVGDIGGLIGTVYGHSSVDNSYNTGSVTVSGGDNYEVGGLAGWLDDYSSISNSYNTGTITALDDIWGISGLVASVGESCLVSNSYNTGAVIAATDSQAVGGLIGFISSSSTITDCYSTGSVTGIQNIGGLVGELSPGATIIVNSHYNIDAVLINGGHLVSYGGIYNAQYADWFSHDKVLDIADYFTLASGYYQINNFADLKNFLGFSDCDTYKFKLAGDIDLTGNSNFYIPYLNVSEFNGDSYSISNLTINLPYTDYIGLFGYVVSPTILSNMHLEDIDITGYSRVGGLAGYTTGSITGSYVTGSASGHGYVGGLVGDNWGTSITNSFADVDVDGDDYCVGGLVGQNASGSITNSYATGNVTGTSSYVGGLVGCNAGNIANSYATGDVNGSGEYVGGLIGYQGSGSITNSYAAGNVNGTNGYVGGLVGYNPSGTVNDSFSVGKVTGSGSYIGGFIGYQNGTVTATSYWYYDPAGTPTHAYGNGTDTNCTKIQDADGGRAYFKKAGNGPYGDWNFTNGGAGGVADRWWMCGYPHLQVEYSTTITNVYQLQMMVLNPDADYTLANNIDASSTSTWNWVSGTTYSGFAPVGDYFKPFTGDFDGNDKTISGLYINRPSTEFVGLFGLVLAVDSDVVIRDVGLTGANITGLVSTGALIGEIWAADYNATVLNCYSTGAVEGVGVEFQSNVGGLIGLASSFSEALAIINSYSTADVIYSGSGSESSTGGLIGCIGRENDGEINVYNCYASGDVEGTGSFGGLIGRVHNDYYFINIYNCYATGNVHAEATGEIEWYAGGLIGSVWNTCFTNIYNSYATGNVTTCVTEAHTSNNIAGGFIGFAEVFGDQMNIYNVYALGDVSATGGDAGAGGLIGSIWDDVGGALSIYNSYSAGAVSSSLSAGGLIGWNESGVALTSCFWDIQTSGQATSAGGTGKTTAEMMAQATFVDWVFDATHWQIDAAESYPYLYYQVWTLIGDTDSSWANASNWSNPIWSGYPDSKDDKAILTGAYSISTPAANALTIGFLKIDSAYEGALTLGNSLILDGTSALCGNITLEAGVLISSGNSITVGGNWTNSGAGYFHGNNTVTFNATITGKTIQTYDQSFYNATFNGVGGGWTLLVNNLTVENDLAITNGTLDVGANRTITANNSFTLTSATAAVIGTAGANITITTNSIDLGSTADKISTTGTITLKPYTQARTKGIGGTAPVGDFNLTAAEIAVLTGYSSLIIGASGDSLAVDIDNVTFEGDTTIYGGAMALETITTTNLAITLITSGASIANAWGNTTDNFTLGSGALNITTGSSSSVGSVGTSGAYINVRTTGVISIDAFYGGTFVSFIYLNSNETAAITLGTIRTINYMGLGGLWLTAAGNVTQNSTITCGGGTLSVIAAGSVILTQSNTVSKLAASSSTGAFSLNNGNNNLTLTGTVKTKQDGGAAITISTGTGSLDTNDQYIQSRNAADSANAAGTITLICDTIDLGSTADRITTTGAIILKPYTQARTKGIGGTAPAGDFNLTAAEIAVLTGYSSLTIGASGDTLAVDIDDVTFEGDTTIYGGAMTVDSITATGKTVTLSATNGSIYGNTSDTITADTVTFVTSDGYDIGKSGATYTLQVNATTITDISGNHPNIFIINNGSGNLTVGDMSTSAATAIDFNKTLTLGNITVASGYTLYIGLNTNGTPTTLNLNGALSTVSAHLVIRATDLTMGAVASIGITGATLGSITLNGTGVFTLRQISTTAGGISIGTSAPSPSSIIINGDISATGGNLYIYSYGNLEVNANVTNNNSGSTTMRLYADYNNSGGGDFIQAAGTAISALAANTQINIYSGSSTSFGSGDVKIGGTITGLNGVNIAAAGGAITSTDNSSLITGTNLSFYAKNGIGTDDAYMNTAASTRVYASSIQQSGTGSIYLNRTNGDLKLATIASYGDVKLKTTTSGNIVWYSNGIQVSAISTITLDSAGDIGASGTPIIISTNHLLINAIADNGSIYLQRTNGDLNLGAINSGGDISLSSSATINQTEDINCAGNFTVGSGTLVASSGALNLTGSALQTVTSNGGHFNTVNITNYSAGGVKFADALYCETLTAEGGVQLIQFAAGATHTITGTLTLNGVSAASRITLKSTLDGSLWNLNTTGATVNVSHANIQDSNSTVAITPSSSHDLGNNINWNLTSYLVITSASSTIAAGSEVTIYITAIDQVGSTALSYIGSKDLIFSGLGSITGYSPTVDGVVLGSATTISFSNGTASATLVAYKPETATLNTTDGTYSSLGHGLDLTVSSATAYCLSWIIQPKANIDAGIIWPIFSLEVLDVFGNRYVIPVNVSLLTSSGSFLGTTTQASSNGIVSFNNIAYNLSNAIVVTASCSNVISATANVNVTSTKAEEATQGSNTANPTFKTIGDNIVFAPALLGAINTRISVASGGMLINLTGYKLLLTNPEINDRKRAIH